MSQIAPASLRAAVECVIKVNDEEITQLYPYLQDVEVQMSRRAATVCTLQFDSFRQEDGDWLVQDAGVLEAWKRIRIEAHFADHVEEVMRGFIREVYVDYPQDMSAARVTVTGQDETLKLDRQHIRKAWSTEEQQMSDVQIARQIADDNDLTPEVDPLESDRRHVSLNQDATSIQFLKQRAEANGYELFARAGALHFHAPRLDGQPQPAIMVYAGKETNCLSFSSRYDGHKPDRVRLTRASETGSELEESVIEPNLHRLGRRAATSSEARGLGTRSTARTSEVPPFEWYLRRAHGATRADVEARAQAAANENAWKLNAEGELDGALYGHVLLTHQTVEVDGVGSTYGGRYYVDEVAHVFSADGYRQRFKLIRNATGE